MNVCMYCILHICCALRCPLQTIPRRRKRHYTDIHTQPSPIKDENKKVFNLALNCFSSGIALSCSGRVFQVVAAALEKQRSPSLVRYTVDVLTRCSPEERN